MNTIENRLMSRLKVMERLSTKLPWMGNQVKNLGIKGMGKTQTDGLSSASLVEESVFVDPHPASASDFPSLQAVLGESGPFAPPSIFLGLCEDGVPLTLNLDNPAPGALLITADPEGGKTRLLRSILSSANLINTSERVIFYILAANPNEYTDLAELDHCKKLIGAQAWEASKIIQELFSELENRKLKTADTIILFAIEGLFQFSQTMDADLLSKLFHLIKHGPRSGIWMIATLSSKDVDQVDPNLLEAFRTHLLGYLADAVTATYLARDVNCPAQGLVKGSQFCASVANEWFSFWICDPAGGVK
jgi:hypothetical protein